MGRDTSCSLELIRYGILFFFSHSKTASAAKIISQMLAAYIQTASAVTEQASLLTPHYYLRIRNEEEDGSKATSLLQGSTKEAGSTNSASV
jgi:hypothetical protein